MCCYGLVWFGRRQVDCERVTGYMTDLDTRDVSGVVFPAGTHTLLALFCLHAQASRCNGGPIDGVVRIRCVGDCAAAAKDDDSIVPVSRRARSRSRSRSRRAVGTRSDANSNSASDSEAAAGLAVMEATPRRTSRRRV